MPGRWDETQIEMETAKENGGQNLGEGPWEGYHARTTTLILGFQFQFAFGVFSEVMFGNWFFLVNATLIYS